MLDTARQSGEPSSINYPNDRKPDGLKPDTLISGCQHKALGEIRVPSDSAESDKSVNSKVIEICPMDRNICSDMSERSIHTNIVACENSVILNKETKECNNHVEIKNAGNSLEITGSNNCESRFTEPSKELRNMSVNYIELMPNSREISPLGKHKSDLRSIVSQPEVKRGSKMTSKIVNSNVNSDLNVNLRNNVNSYISTDSQIHHISSRNTKGSHECESPLGKAKLKTNIYSQDSEKNIKKKSPLGKVILENKGKVLVSELKCQEASHSQKKTAQNVKVSPDRNKKVQRRNLKLVSPKVIWSPKILKSKDHLKGTQRHLSSSSINKSNMVSNLIRCFEQNSTDL